MSPDDTVHGLGPAPGSARARLRSDNYTVAWGAPPAIDPGAGLEVGRGSGHGGTLGWVRFRPGPGGVEVLSVRLDEGRVPYRTRWPPDRAPVSATRGRMGAGAYAALLSELAAVHAATLRPVQRNSVEMATSNFWVHARLVGGTGAGFDLDWAGHYGSDTEVEFAQPSAVVGLAYDAVGRLDPQPHVLTGEERGWVSTTFARDWARFAASDSHWWVRERYLILAGVAGDAGALPVIRAILVSGDPDDRCVYHAINAVTRLTGVDVRGRPVEEMDTAGARAKLLARLGWA